MPLFTDLTGLGGATVVTTAVTVAVGRAVGLRRSWLGPLAALSAVAALAPLGTLPLAGYVRGAVGDLSLTTLVLLLSTLYANVRREGFIDRRSMLALRWLATVGGLVLYPLSLGLGAGDPYRLGYGNPGFLVVLLAVALAALFLDLRLATVCIGLGVLAWALGTYESRNLWDYLLDPLLFAWAFSATLFRGATALVRGHGRALDEALGSRPEP
jgi:hypothetical protein